MAKHARKKSPRRPTDAELIILRVLWDHGPATVRQVNLILNETRPTGHTTTLKQMQVMHGKGLLDCDKTRRPQVYRPTFSQDQTQLQLVGHLMDRAFAGSARTLVLQALRAKDVSSGEVARIEKLLDSLEEEER